MKIIFKLSLLMLLLVAGETAWGQSAKKPDEKPMPILSVFIQPASPHDGRDPFFPESTRPYETAIASHVVQPIVNLTVKGFSGAGGDRLVIINNHTFGVGDESDVLTADGGRVHVRCLGINANGVIVEANNQRRELTFSPQ